MSQDIIADALNQITNALKLGRASVQIRRHSRFLLSILAIAKLKGYIKNYSVDSNGLLHVEFSKLNKCNSIKPRFMVQVKEIEKFARRYLPAKNLGILILSTSQGIMTHQTAQDKNIGGSLIAYMY